MQVRRLLRFARASARLWGRAACSGTMPDMEGVVLVLNQNYEPLNVCNLPRAFRLVFGQRAEVLEYDHQTIRSPRPRVRLTRREVFIRDGYTCQYCGHQASDLTLDHVVPRHRGGPHTWDNLVTACKACNHKKGGKLLEEARLRLAHRPAEPRCNVYSLFSSYLRDDRNAAWRSYIFLGH